MYLHGNGAYKPSLKSHWLTKPRQDTEDDNQYKLEEENIIGRGRLGLTIWNRVRLENRKQSALDKGSRCQRKWPAVAEGGLRSIKALPYRQQWPEGIGRLTFAVRTNSKFAAGISVRGARYLARAARLGLALQND
jgi:hypothetical protein